MNNIKKFISEDKIEKRVKELSKLLYDLYKDEEVTFVCTLKGAVFFCCDLMKEYKGNATLSFIRVSSYNGENSTGNISLKIPLNKDNIEGKNVLIIEDIVDTGITMNYLRNYIKSMNPKTIKACTLLNKESRRIINVPVEYKGFDIDDLFVIGYGLDLDEKYRNLPFIGIYNK